MLDLTSIVMGPFSTQILGDHGADVILVEPPEGGMNRRMGGATHPDFSGIALNLLRNKRSIGLDLKHAEGAKILLRLAGTCDVVVTNLRPKPLERLSFTYEDVRAVREDIVYCQAQGFRTDGARADEPAYDDIIQAESGLADAARLITGEPQLAPTIIADKVCGLAIAGAVTAALFHRERTGRGQRVELPMLDVMRAFVLVEHGSGAIADPSADAGYARVLSPQRGPQETADGWINILPYSSNAYDAIFLMGGREDMVGHEMTRGLNMIHNANALYAQLRPIIRTRTTNWWLEFCRDKAIPVGRVVSLKDAVADCPLASHPVVGDYRLIAPPIIFSDSPCAVNAPAPGVGEHSREILRESGLGDIEIEDLIDKRAVLATRVT